jgi:hypothetical protein
LDDGPTIEALLAAYPKGVVVSDIEHPSGEVEDNVSIAQSLYREGFLFIEDEATLPFDVESGADSNDDSVF